MTKQNHSTVTGLINEDIDIPVLPSPALKCGCFHSLGLHFDTHGMEVCCEQQHPCYGTLAGTGTRASFVILIPGTCCQVLLLLCGLQ